MYRLRSCFTHMNYVRVLRTLHPNGTLLCLRPLSTTITKQVAVYRPPHARRTGQATPDVVVAGDDFTRNRKAFLDAVENSQRLKTTLRVFQLDVHQVMCLLELIATQMKFGCTPKEFYQHRVTAPDGWSELPQNALLTRCLY